MPTIENFDIKSSHYPTSVTKKSCQLAGIYQQPMAGMIRNTSFLGEKLSLVHPALFRKRKNLLLLVTKFMCLLVRHRFVWKRPSYFFFRFQPTIDMRKSLIFRQKHLGLSENMVPHIRCFWSQTIVKFWKLEFWGVMCVKQFHKPPPTSPFL
jgi:hypothetical protein